MRRIFVACALTALLAACGSDSTSPASADITGTYTLKTVNGSPLPFTLQSGTTVVSLTSDVIIVSSNGTWSESGIYQQTVNGQTTSGTGSDGGTWTRAGTSVTLTSAQGADGTYTGSYSTNTLTLSNSGFVSVFTK